MWQTFPPPTLHIPPSLLLSLPHVPPPLSVPDGGTCLHALGPFNNSREAKCGSMSLIARLSGESTSLPHSSSPPPSPLLPSPSSAVAPRLWRCTQPHVHDDCKKIFKSKSTKDAHNRSIHQLTVTVTVANGTMVTIERGADGNFHCGPCGNVVFTGGANAVQQHARNCVARYVKK